VVLLIINTEGEKSNAAIVLLLLLSLLCKQKELVHSSASVVNSEMRILRQVFFLWREMGPSLKTLNTRKVFKKNENEKSRQLIMKKGKRERERCASKGGLVIPPPLYLRLLLLRCITKRRKI